MSQERWGDGAPRGARQRCTWVVHNLVAHPLLILCPPLGRFVHDATAPRGER